MTFSIEVEPSVDTVPESFSTAGAAVAAVVSGAAAAGAAVVAAGAGEAL